MYNNKQIFDDNTCGILRNVAIIILILISKEYKKNHTFCRHKIISKNLQKFI